MTVDMATEVIRNKITDYLQILFVSKRQKVFAFPIKIGSYLLLCMKNENSINLTLMFI